MINMERIKQLTGFPLESSSESRNLSHRFIIAQFLLRVLVVVFTVVAIAVMATSTAPITMVALGLNFMARYSDSSAFRFLMGADIVVCALSLVSLVASYFLYRKQSNLNYVNYFFGLDLVLMVLMISACGAASAIGYVAVYGQQQSLWFTICDHAGSFCMKNGISVAFSYVAFLCLFALTIMPSIFLRYV